MLIDDELERMHRIVNDLLTLAKAERADFLRLGPVDLAALTEEVHAKAEALGERGWRLGGVGRGIVIADRQRLTQAMMQLAQNAVQHTAPGDEIEIGSRVLGPRWSCGSATRERASRRTRSSTSSTGSREADASGRPTVPGSGSRS